jgi:Stigma-specific protein, Stig1
VSQQTTNRTFDELARALASGTLSRGKALRLMGAALVGSALGSIPGVAWAGDDRCSEGQTRCGERCVNLKTNERHCGSCRNRCRSTQTCCKGRCVNLQRNERHCGECFNRCDEGEECVNGVCGGGEPICDPPCTDAEHECAEVPGGGQTFCQPICPGCNCSCFDLADGTGVACVACEVGCPRAPNDDCSRCATDFPGTICVVTPLSTAPICCQPAA